MKREVYTVMADNGVGEFLWHKDDGDPSPPVGPNLYSLMDERDPETIMSTKLFHEFCDWARWYMSTEPCYYPLEERDIDWDRFNREGMRLATCLKAELGSKATVVYVKAWDDPTEEKYGYIEIHNRDGLS